MQGFYIPMTDSKRRLIKYFYLNWFIIFQALQSLYKSTFLH